MLAMRLATISDDLRRFSSMSYRQIFEIRELGKRKDVPDKIFGENGASRSDECDFSC